MADIFKFPCGGYDVDVLRKEDIINRIQDDSINKNLLLKIVEHCEKQAAEYLKDGRWAGIPYIGNIRIPKTVQNFISEESKALFEDAEQTLNREAYIAFRKNYSKDVGKQVNINRYHNYITSKIVASNKKFFRRIASMKGDIAAKIICYSLSNLTIVPTDEQIQIDN